MLFSTRTVRLLAASSAPRLRAVTAWSAAVLRRRNAVSLQQGEFVSRRTDQQRAPYSAPRTAGASYVQRRRRSDILFELVAGCVGALTLLMVGYPELLAGSVGLALGACALFAGAVHVLLSLHWGRSAAQALRDVLIVGGVAFFAVYGCLLLLKTLLVLLLDLHSVMFG